MQENYKNTEAYISGFRDGFASGKSQAEEQLTIKFLDRIIQCMHLNPDDVLKLLQVPKSKRASYKRIIKARMAQKPEKYAQADDPQL